MNAPANALQRHRFDVVDYRRTGVAGVFGPDARVESIDGELIDMVPVGPNRNAAVDRLNRLLTIVEARLDLDTGPAAEDVVCVRKLDVDGEVAPRLPDGDDVRNHRSGRLVRFHRAGSDRSTRRVQSRKFLNCSGSPRSASFSTFMAACRSSRFLPVTRS